MGRVSSADFSIALAGSAERSASSSSLSVGREEGRAGCLGMFPEAGVLVGRLHSEPPTTLPLNFSKDISLCLPGFHSDGA